MLEIHTHHITLGAEASDKVAAIRLVASKLVDAQFVKSGYIDGMLAREQQSSTFLGNGIAIPHGTTDTRDQVEQTGLQLVQFPQGVDWGDGNTVYLAIGIAAKSDEHLTILRQLTHVLDQDGLIEQLQSIQNPQQIVDILAGNSGLKFSPESILLDFPASNITQLQAVAAGQLKQTGAIGDNGIAPLMQTPLTHLGEGVWLNASTADIKATGVCIVRTHQPFSYQEHPCQLLISVVAKDNQHQAILEKLTALLAQGQLASLLTATDEKAIYALLAETSSAKVAAPAAGALQETVILKNPHGLHARPGAMLVKAIKEYDVNVTVENLTEGNGPVNGRSLMKVIGLGARHGHELRFTAEGEQAREALDHIKAQIEAGLGEEL
ncbi:fused PTS fructose transporter subunit IIA/HPr protein [Celerinatantimonas sp. YJH-8]|uniref:fused PTS fructose transporter subunit IIA/HPr protein n=1 Tax=Celerinatantimonas sp. YJH-8 TaxID=3228714 RepID=UPI0038BF1E0E